MVRVRVRIRVRVKVRIRVRVRFRVRDRVSPNPSPNLGVEEGEPARVRAAVPLPGDVFARLQVHAVPVDHLGEHLLCVAPAWPRLQVRSEPVRVRVRVRARDRVRVAG